MSARNDNRPGDSLADITAMGAQLHEEMQKHLAVLKEAVVEAHRLQRELACYRNALYDVIESSGDQRAITIARLALARGASIP